MFGNRKIVCMFAALKNLFTEAGNLPRRCVKGFFYALMQTMIYGTQPRAYIVMVYASLCKKTLAAGSGRRFSVPHAIKSYKL